MISRFFLRVVFCLLLLPSVYLPSLSFAQAISPYITEDFILFWPNPVRAHPNVPIDFRFTFYDAHNKGVNWQLINAPSGMNINSEGLVSWTPSSAQVGNYSITIRLTRNDGVVRERTFSLSVNTSDFVFVSTQGSDSNSGTISSPYRTILQAMNSIANGNGKTIYIRGGTYQETYNWEANEVYSPFRSKNFSSADPLEIRGYPGESAILNCNLSGHGFWFFRTSYALLNNITVINARADERAGILSSESDNIVIRDTVVRDSNWSRNTNCTGYNIEHGNVVLDRAIGYNNKDTTSDHWNSSNFLFYLGKPSAGDAIYVLNSKSWGSVVGFKVKHAGQKKLIIHNSESFGNEYAYALGSENSSLRHSVAFNNNIGVFLGMADPNAYTDGPALVEQNTFVNLSGAAIDIQTGYLYGSEIKKNAIVNTLSAAVGGEYDNRLMQFWIYDDLGETRALSSNNNLFYSPSTSNIVRLGANYSTRNYSFSSWQSLGRDSQSVFSNPLFSNPTSGNLTLPSNSSANRGNGAFYGAYPVGLSVVVGAQSFSLPNWGYFGSSSSFPTTTSTTTTSVTTTSTTTPTVSSTTSTSTTSTTTTRAASSSTTTSTTTLQPTTTTVTTTTSPTTSLVPTTTTTTIPSASKPRNLRVNSIR
jgi:Putative Ig domain